MIGSGFKYKLVGKLTRNTRDFRRLFRDCDKIPIKVKDIKCLG